MVIRIAWRVFVGSMAALLVPVAAWAQEAGAAAAGGMPILGYAVGAGLAVGLAGLGCGIGQGIAAGNTTAGIARNPGAAGSMFVQWIVSMALIESIAIYGFVIALFLNGHITG